MPAREPIRGSDNLPRREYGKDKIPLSAIGLGGTILMEESQRDADRWVKERRRSAPQ